MKFPSISIVPTIACMLLGSMPVRGQFQPPEPLPTAVEAFDACTMHDMDGDGDEDMLTNELFGALFYRQNLAADGGPDAWAGTMATILTGPAAGAFCVIDREGDGDPDILITAWDTARWLLNDGTASFTTGTDLVTGQEPLNDAHAADMDGDGLVDLVLGGTTVFWKQNLGGGSFAAPEQVAPTPIRSRSLRSGDLDLDGDLDLIYEVDVGSAVAIVVAADLDGSGTTWSNDTLPERDSLGVTFPGGMKVQLLDLDGDGDLDIGGELNGSVVWWENRVVPDGTWPVFDLHTVVVADPDLHLYGCYAPLGCGPGSSLVYAVEGIANSSLRRYDPVLGDFTAPVPIPGSLAMGLHTYGHVDLDDRYDLIIEETFQLNAISDTVQVVSPPLTPGLDTLCAFGGQYVLPDGDPMGGIWSGPSVANNAFDASSAPTGSYALTYTVVDTSGCPASAQDTLQVIMEPAISMDPILSNYNCPQSDVQFMGSPAGGAWVAPGISASGLLSMCASGTGPVIYDYTDATGSTCYAEGPFLQLWGCTPISAPEMGPYCLNDPIDSVSYYMQGPVWFDLSGDFFYVSLVPSGSGAIVTGYFDPANGPGDHPIVLSIGGAQTCPTSDTSLVTVYPLPATEILSNGPYCANEASAQVVASGPGIFSGSISGMNDTLTFDPSAFGAGSWPFAFMTSEVHITATDTTTCNNALVDSLLINPTPAQPVISFSNDSLIVSSGSGSFQWYRDHVAIPGATDSIYLYQYPDTGSYTVTFTDTNGCTSDTSFAFTVTGVGPGSLTAHALGILTIYPNPSTGDFLLMPDAHDTDPITVRITDAVGRSVLGPLVLNGQAPTAIHLSDVRSGLYLLRATRRTEERLFKVVVRE
ncbi:MAG: T9SS type A sorting domain-containing protein [Flavobacteriales bacterium]|nr:T9SS type A sorting domain-containing protein [Flavobacteriales bacterium]